MTWWGIGKNLGGQTWGGRHSKLGQQKWSKIMKEGFRDAGKCVWSGVPGA